MTSRAKHRRHKRLMAKAGLDAESAIGFVCAWCADESQLMAALITAHDILVKLMGEDRTGGVRWINHTGPVALEELSVINDMTADPILRDYYANIEERLRDEGGYLVVALAEDNHVR